MLTSQLAEARSFAANVALRDLIIRLLLSALGLVIAFKIAG